MSCCGNHHDHKDKHHRQDCFCGKFPKYLLGQVVIVGTIAGTLTGVTFRLACVDEKSGIITLVVVTAPEGSPLLPGALFYACCKDIAFISPVPPVAG
ncbi:hypothetical protein K7887_07030 [Sutcliffiella horikoshii]|uniref:hypothetical protein n=1 Tax=Sutcliffiella horikoshii TaxID=79883 RepID=UPI001CBE70E8|nr:hypothetical protein [Sutcliffiella horikoshii]UAL48679.1 hypothetical protein K7887_07030 [Sutcliffiella horikoshii]